MFLMLPLLTEAQTIGQVDLPVPGSSWVMGTDTSYSGAIPSQGLGQTWDFSVLQNHIPDTTIFIDAIGTPYESSFPASNMASYTPIDERYSYFTNDPNGFYFDGSIGLSGAILFNPPQLYMPTPFSYGDQRTSTSRYQFDTTIVDSMGGSTNFRFVSFTDGFYKVDGTGNLILPSGSYQDCLRIKVTETVYDSVLMDMGGTWMVVSANTSINIIFRVVTSGLQANFLLDVNGDSLGTSAVDASFYVSTVDAVPNIAIEKNKVVTYPNPAFNDIKFKNILENTDVKIFDNHGKEIMKSTSIANGSLNVERLVNGVYHYEVNQKGKIEKGSFVIQH